MPPAPASPPLPVVAPPPAPPLPDVAVVPLAALLVVALVSSLRHAATVNATAATTARGSKGWFIEGPPARRATASDARPA